MKKKLLVFLGIMFGFLILDYSFASNNEISIDKSKTYDNLSQCNKDLEEYNISNPDFKRSNCYLSGNYYYYNICTGASTCKEGTGMNNTSNANSQSNSGINEVIELIGGNGNKPKNPYKEKFDKLNIELKFKILRYLENRKKDPLKKLELTSKSISKILEKDRIEIKGVNYKLSTSKIIGPIFGYLDFEIKEIIKKKKVLSEEENLNNFFGGEVVTRTTSESNNSKKCDGTKPSGEGVFLSKNIQKGSYKNWIYNARANTSYNCAWKCKEGFVKDGNGCKEKNKNIKLNYKNISYSSAEEKCRKLGMVVNKRISKIGRWLAYPGATYHTGYVHFYCSKAKDIILPNIHLKGICKRGTFPYSQSQTVLNEPQRLYTIGVDKPEWHYVKYEKYNGHPCTYTCKEAYKRIGNNCVKKNYLKCKGTPPSGENILKGGVKYRELQNNSFGKTKWTYFKRNMNDITPNIIPTCMWSCKKNYIKSGNKCIRQ